MKNGNLVLNGITDQELVKLLDVKIRHESSVSFNPQQMQAAAQTIQGKQTNVYNNVVLGWADEKGLEAVQEIVHFLLKKDEKAKAQGQ